MQNKDTSFTLAQAGAINALTETEQKDGRINDTVVQAGNLNFIHNKLDGFQNGIQDELENVATLDGAPLNPADPTQCATVIDARLKKDFSSLPTATSPSGADLLVVQQSGVSKSVSYTALQAGALVPLQTQIISSPVATVDITSIIDGTYKEYIVKFINIIPSTDDVGFLSRISQDNGSTWKSGGSDYLRAAHFKNSGNFVFSESGTGSAMALSDSGGGNGLSFISNEPYNGEITLYNPSSTSHIKQFSGKCVYTSDNGSLAPSQAIGNSYTADNAAYNAIQLLMSSGTIASGIIKIYGVK